MTLYNIVDFGEDRSSALLAICAGLTAVILWASVAWIFGLPTSESHALISGISGAAIANRMSLDAINVHEWKLVLIGLLATTFPPFILGYIFNKAIGGILRNCPRRRVMRYFFRAERISAASSALLHGAQDSQKFIGIYVLALALYKNREYSGESIPFYVIFTCAAVMTLGTMLGGARIIKKVGCDMTELDAASGSASDAASSAVLLFCSLWGIPASTTHSKACAIMGTGLSKKSGLDLRIAGQLVGAWCLTFPICALLGFGFYFLFTICFY
jgi:PiT family inorganic phosphate transporter